MDTDAIESREKAWKEVGVEERLERVKVILLDLAERSEEVSSVVESLEEHTHVGDKVMAQVTRRYSEFFTWAKSRLS